MFKAGNRKTLGFSSRNQRATDAFRMVVTQFKTLEGTNDVEVASIGEQWV